MSIIRKVEKRALSTAIDPYQITARPTFGNYSGEFVNEDNAFTSSAFLATTTIIADSIATMPLEVLRYRGDTIERLNTPPVFQQPNEEQSMFAFIHQAVLTLAIHGTDYIYAPRPMGAYLPVEMRNLNPLVVKRKHQPAQANQPEGMYYHVGKRAIPSADIKQVDWIRLPMRDKAISPLDTLRNVIGTDLAINRFLAQFYGDNGVPGSVLETDQQITEEQARIVRDTWEDMHYKRRRPAVLSGGLKWRSVNASAVDMDTMAHRESIVREIARVYRVPLHLILGTGGDNQTYQNVESAGINFVRHTLLPWMRRLEDALSSMLPRPQFVRFNADEFMRADLTTRVRAQQIQIQSGTLSPNEARHIEGREPYEGGDQFILGIAGAQPIGMDALPPTPITPVSDVA